MDLQYPTLFTHYICEFDKMLYPFDDLLRSPSPNPKPNSNQITNYLFQRNTLNSNSNLSIKLPLLRTMIMTERKSQQLSNDALKSILQKSVSLDLTEESKRKASLEFKKSHNRGRIGEHSDRLNRFNHYVNYIESLNQIKNKVAKKPEVLLELNSAKMEEGSSKSQMPYIRAQKMECHRKYRSIKVSSMTGDQTFIRIKSPHKHKSINSTLVPRHHLLETIDHSQTQEVRTALRGGLKGVVKQRQIEGLKTQNNKKLCSPTKNPVRGKKQKILSMLISGPAEHFDTYCTPWSHEYEQEAWPVSDA